MKPSHNEIQQSTIRKIEEVISHPKVQQLIKKLSITRQEIIKHWPIIDHVKDNDGYTLQRNEHDQELEQVVLQTHIKSKRRQQSRHAHLTTIQGKVVDVNRFNKPGKTPFIAVIVQEKNKLDETRCVTFSDHLEVEVTTGDQVAIKGRQNTYNGEISYIFKLANIQKTAI